MAAKPRKSAFGGNSPTSPSAAQSALRAASLPESTETPPASATAPAPTPSMAPAPASAPRPTVRTPSRRVKESYYATTEEDGRIRAAFYAGRSEFGWRNMTDMQLQAVMSVVEDLEVRHNNGEPFEGMPPGTGPVGKPLER